MPRSRTSSGPPLLLLLAPALLAAAAHARGDVWVVDDDGGPGVDFVNLQPAVNAASDGDLVLVRSGLYAGFTVFDKSVDVVAEVEGSVVCLGGIAVRNLASGRHVTLRGLRVTNADEEGLQVKNCVGSVWVEGCTLRGSQGNGVFTDPAQHPEGWSGAAVVGTGDVVFARCTLEGGDGSGYVPLFAIHGDGGHGLEVSGARVSLHDCTLRGGAGGDVFDDDAAWTGGAGGHGLFTTGGQVFASGTTFEGGDGGVGGEDFDLFFGYSCADGGPGGHGVFEPLNQGPVEVDLLACTFSPGAGGAPFPGSTCTSGPDGAPITVPNGAVVGLAGPSFGHVATTPVRAGDTVTFTMTGEPGAFAVLGVAAGPTWFFDQGLSGTVLVDPTAVLFFPGFVPPSGSLVLQLTANLQVPPGQAVTVVAQPGFYVPSTLGVVLGAGSWVAVLDPAL